MAGGSATCPASKRTPARAAEENRAASPRISGTSKEAQVEDAALERIQAVLENGGAARSVELSDEEAAMNDTLQKLQQFCAKNFPPTD